MTLVKIPLPIRIVAYILGVIIGGLGGPIVVFLLARGTIDSDLATLITAVVALVVILAGTLALSHLSLPDAPTEAPDVAPVSTLPPMVTITTDSGASTVTPTTLPTAVTGGDPTA